MKHIVVDLEMNTILANKEARKISRCETIEIGAVMLDDKLQEISSFRTYIKPSFSAGIAHNITKLTGITDDMVVRAPKFPEAFRMFTNWCMGTGEEVTLYAWSDTDYNQIKKDILLNDYVLSEEENRNIMDTEWTDFQMEFDKHLGFSKQLSLKNALEMAGIHFAGREHDALDDAKNTAELLQLFKDKTLFDETLKRIEDAMKPKTLGSTLGDKFDFSAFVFE